MLRAGVLIVALCLASAGGAQDPDPADRADTVPPALRDFDSVLLDNEAPTTTGVGSWLKGGYLSGDWGGWRTRLSEAGVQFAATYVTDILGNPIGGLNHKVRYFHDIGLDLLLDLERLVKLDGSRLHVSLSSRAGHSLSDLDIGNVFNVAQTCCEPHTRVVNLAWQQFLFDETLDVHVGYLTTGDVFATSPLYWLFVNSGINSNPGSLGFNVPFSLYPDSALGGRARWKPGHEFDLEVGVYNGSIIANAGMSDSLSVRFDDGALMIVEAGYRLDLGTSAQPLRGHYRLGGYYHTGRFRRFTAPPGSDLPRDYEHGSGAMYALLDQAVWHATTTPSEHSALIPFLALVGAPDQAINEFPFFFDAGLVLRAPFARREDDAIIFGFLYGGFSDDLRDSQRALGEPPQEFEMALEWAYVYQVTPWFQIEPDVQYIIRPGGTGAIGDALVLGVEISVNM